MKIKVLTQLSTETTAIRKETIIINDKFVPLMKIKCGRDITPELQELYREFVVDVYLKVKPKILIGVLGDIE